MNLRDLFGVGTKLKQSIFFQQNGPERGQVQDWYSNENIVVVPICLNDRCVLQDVWILYCIKKDKDDESLPLLAFRRDVVNAIFLTYSKEGRLSSSHAGIRNTPSGEICEKTRHVRQTPNAAR